MTSSRRPGLERKSETRLWPWFSLTPNQPTALFSSGPLYHCSQFHGLLPLLWNFMSQYILFPMLVRTWAARRLLFLVLLYHWERLCLWPQPWHPLQLCHSGLTGSISPDIAPSPQRFLVISAAWAICVTSLSQSRAPPAFFPLPRWWEPTVCPAAARFLLTSLRRTCLFLSGSWDRGHLHKEKALAVAFLLPPFHFSHLMCFKREWVFARSVNKIKQ